MSPAARANTATLEVETDALRGRDGFDVRVTVRLPIKLHDGPLDRAAFAKNVGEGRVVSESAEKIVKLVGDDVRAAVAAVAEGDAEELLAMTDRFAEAAADAARLPLFKLGLMLDGPATATADAPALRQRRAEQAAADASRAAADRADDLLRRFEDIRRQSPDVPPGRLLMALPPEDRRDALMKLFEAAGKQEPGRLMLAAGVRLFEVESGQHVREMAELGELGPIRCLRKIKHAVYDLSAGARDGVILIRSKPATFNDNFHKHKVLNARGQDTGLLGFNDVAVRGRFVWATHSTRGLACWMTQKVAVDYEVETFAAFAPATCVEALEVDLAICATGSKVLLPWADMTENDAADLVRTGDGTTIQPSSDSTVVRLLARGLEQASQTCIAVRSDGSLIYVFRADDDDGNLQLEAGESLAQTITTACAVPWLGDVRVAACVADGPVVVGGPDDDVVIEYQSEHRGFAAVAASGGRLAAVTGDRQRVVVWNLHEPDWPISDLYALADTRSRVADVAFL